MESDSDVKQSTSSVKGKSMTSLLIEDIEPIIALLSS